MSPRTCFLTFFTSFFWPLLFFLSLRVRSITVLYSSQTTGLTTLDVCCRTLMDLSQSTLDLISILLKAARILVKESYPAPQVLFSIVLLASPLRDSTYSITICSVLHIAINSSQRVVQRYPSSLYAHGIPS